jgi:catechol 2,3-dioxygenase-like lactoylglutathione lyase family enzyme
MLDHVSITVSDLAAAEPFYDAIMKAIGVPKVRRSELRLGYGDRWTNEIYDGDLAIDNRADHARAVDRIEGSLMSAFGTKRTSQSRCRMSAFEGKADIARTSVT